MRFLQVRFVESPVCGKPGKVQVRFVAQPKKTRDSKCWKIARNHYNKRLKSGKLVGTEILSSDFLSLCVDWRKSRCSTNSKPQV
jgi:hypothetical protein